MRRRIARLIAKTGRFLTFCGGAAPIGLRLRPDPAERSALKIVRETDAGRCHQRSARHAHEPGLCRGRLCRRADRRQDRRALRQLHRAGRGAGRHDDLPQDRGARQRLHRAADQPFRRTRRPDVARGCVHPVGAGVPGRAVTRADRHLAVMASSVRLARQGRVHARPGAGAGRCDGAQGASADHRVHRRSGRRSADRARLPYRRRARPRIHGRAAIATPTTRT